MLLSGFITVIIGISCTLLSNYVSVIETMYSSIEIVNSFSLHKKKMKNSMISSIEALFICVLFFIITKQAQDIFYNIPYAFFASIFVVLLLCDNVILIIDFFNYLTIKEIYSSPTRLLKYITEESEREIFPKREKHKEMDSKKALISNTF